MTSELTYQHPAKQEDDLLSPKTGTATSSPLEKTTSPIFQCCWEMKKQGYADTTLKTTGKRLRNIARHANIENPEQVKTFIASKECTNGFKEGLAKAYDLYVKFRELNWNKPFCERYDKQEDSQRPTV